MSSKGTIRWWQKQPADERQQKKKKKKDVIVMCGRSDGLLASIRKKGLMGGDTTQLRRTVAGVLKACSFLGGQHWVESQTLRRSWNRKNLRPFLAVGLKKIPFHPVWKGIPQQSLVAAYKAASQKKKKRTESSNSGQINNQTKKENATG